MVILGVVLVVGGIAGLILGRWMRPRVAADRGSVAVGGDSYAPIAVTTHTTQEASADSLFWKIWNITCGVATLLGLMLGAFSVVLTLWPPHS